MALRPGNRTAHCWGTVGALALSHYPAGSRKAEGDFRQRMPGTLFYGSLPRKPHSPSPVLWGYGRFRITSPGMEAMP